MHHFLSKRMLLLRLLISAIALMGISYYLPGIEVASFYTALITAIVLGILNAILRPILTLLTLPITLLTLGLFALGINALIFWLVSTVVKGFTVESLAARWRRVKAMLYFWPRQLLIACLLSSNL